VKGGFVSLVIDTICAFTVFFLVDQNLLIVNEFKELIGNTNPAFPIIASVLELIESQELRAVNPVV
jgi:hypothetical protein